MQLKAKNRFRPGVEGLECRDVPTSSITSLANAYVAGAKAQVPNIYIATPNITIIPVVQLNIAVLGKDIVQINVGNIHI